MVLEQVPVLIGGALLAALHALGERAADLVDVQRGREVSDVGVGVGEGDREDEAVPRVRRGTPTARLGQRG